MNPSDWAQVFRGMILCGLMVASALAPINAWTYARHHKGPQDARRRRENILKAVSVATYASGAFYGTYSRLDQEFSWALPLMGFGIMGYCVYLFLVGNEHDELPKYRRSEDRELDRLLNER